MTANKPKGYWDDYNPICKGCINTCKQSHVVTLVRCYEYKALDPPLESKTKTQEDHNEQRACVDG